MSDFIEEFYYGNIEPQECTTELKPKVMKCLNELAQKEKHLFDTLNDEDKELFNKWNEYKANKDFENADKIRQNLIERGLL